MKKNLFIFCAFTIIGLACSMPKSINSSIKSNELPAQYQKTDNNKITKISIAQYFKDTLLLNLIDSALVYNNDLQIAYQKVELAKSMLLYNKGNLLPQLSAGANSGIKRFGLYTMDGAGNSTTDITPGNKIPLDLTDLYLGVQTSWEIDFRGKLLNQKRSAAAKLLATQEGLKYVKINLISEVSHAYYNLIALDKELEIISATTKKQMEALDYVKAQKEAGKSNELAVLQFSAQLHNLNILELEVRQQMSRVENQLNFLIGRFPQFINRDKNGLNSSNVILNTGIPSELLTNRPDIQQATYQLAAMRLDVKAAKAAFLPNFIINSGVGYQAFNSTYLFRSPESMAYSFLGGLIAPLVNKTGIQSTFNAAKASEIEALALYQQRVLNGFVEVVNGVTEVNVLEKINILTINKNLENNNAVESALFLYKSARVPYLDVIISQQNALQSNLELIDIARRIKIANINLYKSLGGAIE